MLVLNILKIRQNKPNVFIKKNIRFWFFESCNSFSKSAKEAIEKAGGEVTVIE